MFTLALRAESEWTARVNTLFMERHEAWNRKLETSDWLKPLEGVQVAADEVFLKRAYLDAVGRLPRLDEARAFLEDKAGGKRAALVDKLLDSPEWGERWFQRLASLLRLVDEVNGASQQPYVDWVKNAARNNMPMDDLVRTLLSAEGSVGSNPATGYMLRDAGWMEDTMVATAQAFLGVSLECTLCHDHPFADWTQMQFYRLCACVGSARITRGPAELPAGQPAPKPRKTKPLFSGGKQLPNRILSERVDHGEMPMVLQNEVWPASERSQRELRKLVQTGGHALEIHDGYPSGVRLPTSYKYRDGKSGEMVKPGMLQIRAVRSALLDEQAVARGPTVRAELAAWLVGHPRFGQRLAQWMVASLMQNGSGLSYVGAEPELNEGVLWMGPERGCSEAGPSMLIQRELDEEPIYEALGLMVKALGYDMKEVQRVLMKSMPYQAVSRASEMGETFHYAGPKVRRMSPEAVWDALVSLGGGPEASAGLLHTKDLPQRLPEDHALRLLGRGERVLPVDDVATVSFGLCRWFLTSPMVQRAAEGVASKVKDADELFLTVLSRHPTEDEQRICRAHLAKPKNTFVPLAAALLCGSDFLFVK
ncbi:MAG: DUF1549 domain-containing protein [Verrucomicrobiaceae bacterium]|nr:DUF1549 domain-containing protein [Verrucomicrobiaceae bacterium]